MDKREKELADKRFTLNTENIRITFIPQCCSCKNNINLTVCKQFSEKPYELRKNQQICQYHEKRV